MSAFNPFTDPAFIAQCKDALIKEPFWDLDANDTVNELQKQHRNTYLLKTLPSLGFGNLRLQGKTLQVQTWRNIVREVTHADVREFVAELLNQIGRGREVLAEMTLQRQWFFGESIFTSLPYIKAEPLADTRISAYRFFRNGVVVIENRGQEISMMPFSELKGQFVWADQILDREISLESLSEQSVDKLLEEHTNTGSHHFLQWCQNLCKDMSQSHSQDGRFDPERFKSLLSSFGYLLHRHWNEYKCIVFIDQDLQPDEANGRTGKSVVLNYALNHCLNTEVVNGKKLGKRNQVDKFTFHSVTPATQYICFDDVKEEFDFSNLFSIITGPLEVERKYGGIFKFGTDQKPKMAISTNHLIKGEGTSYEDRQHVVEIGSFYRDLKFVHGIDPEEYHEGGLFKGNWGSKDWEEFDLFCIGALRFYLQHGLVGGGTTENYKLNKLYQKVGSRTLVDALKSFLEINAGQKVYSRFVEGMGEELRPLCLRDSIEEECAGVKLSPQKITDGFRQVAKHYGYGINVGATGRQQERFGPHRKGVDVYAISVKGERNHNTTANSVQPLSLSKESGLIV